MALLCSSPIATLAARHAAYCKVSASVRKTIGRPAGAGSPGFNFGYISTMVVQHIDGAAIMANYLRRAAPLLSTIVMLYKKYTNQSIMCTLSRKHLKYAVRDGLTGVLLQPLPVRVLSTPRQSVSIDRSQAAWSYLMRNGLDRPNILHTGGRHSALLLREKNDIAYLTNRQWVAMSSLAQRSSD